MTDLEAKIKFAVAKAGGQKAVAFKLGMSESDLSRMLNGERGWKIGNLSQVLWMAGMRVVDNGTKDASGDSDSTLIRELTRKLLEQMELVEHLRSLGPGTEVSDSNDGKEE